MQLDPNHPAIRLGNWLKSQRQAHGFVKRVFASIVHLCPAKYTEVEAGVVAWIEKKNEEAIVSTLKLADELLAVFNDLLADARKAAALSFSTIFSRAQLTPVRTRLGTDRAISDMEKEIILDAVFAPLS